jgi:DNA polymerase I-like protein with 3'-5' exonuclease and polymerase domains
LEVLEGLVSPLSRKSGGLLMGSKFQKLLDGLNEEIVNDEIHSKGTDNTTPPLEDLNGKGDTKGHAQKPKHSEGGTSETSKTLTSFSKKPKYCKEATSKTSKTTETSQAQRIEVIDTVEELDEVAEVLGTEKEIGLDLETYPRDETGRGLDPRRGQVGLIALADRGSTFLIDRKVLPPKTILKTLQNALSGKALVTHNGATFDLAFLRRSVGYEHDGFVYDTMVLDGLLFYATGPVTKKDDWRGFLKKDKDQAYRRSLADVAKTRLGIELDKEEQAADWGGPLTEEMAYYAATDASILLPLKDKLLELLADIGMEEVAENEARFSTALAYCSDNGFALDVEGWRENTIKAKEAVYYLQEQCNKLAGEPPEDVGEWAWSASNHRKVGWALEGLGAKVEKKAKTGNYITSESALKAIKSPPAAALLAETILEFRGYDKHANTWGASWFAVPKVNRKGKPNPDHLQVVGGRVHSKFNQLVASGRGSSTCPNLQNIPPELRRFFIAPPGRLLVVGDYSQVEYVTAAYIAGDEALLAPLREALASEAGGKFDFHTITAEMVGIERGPAKTVNFGILYGMSAKGLGKRLGVDEKVAQGYIDTIFNRAPGLHRWYQQQSNRARRRAEYAVTKTGRRRMVDQYRTWDYRTKTYQWKSSKPMLLNHPIQGLCAEGYKVAAAMLWERREEFKGNPLLVNMVHDELVQETDEGAAEHDARLQKQIMVEGMKSVLGADAPIDVSITISDHWTKD